MLSSASAFKMTDNRALVDTMCCGLTRSFCLRVMMRQLGGGVVVWKASSDTHRPALAVVQTLSRVVCFLSGVIIESETVSQ